MFSNGSTSHTSNKVILVVEDELALHEAIKLKLSRAGMQVYSAFSGEQALEILSGIRPNLVWLDLLLPGMGGLELLRRMRADESMKDIPVMVVSVSAGPEKIKQARDLHAIDYMVKSEYTIESLVNRVKEVTATLS